MSILSPDKDSFGAAINDFYKGNINKKINVVSDIAGRENIPVKYLFRTINQMPILEHIALNKCKGKVLDIGAGAGCHSIVLQNRGFDVTALEVSSLASDVMKKMGIRKVVNSDIFDFKSEKFDTLLLLMNGIGLTGTMGGYSKFLNHAKDLLTEKGQIIFDSADVKYIYRLRNIAVKTSYEKYYGEITYKIKYNNIKNDPFKWLFIDFNTARQLAISNGYSISLLGKEGRDNYLVKLLPDKKKFIKQNKLKTGII